MMRKLLTFLKTFAIAALIAGCGETGNEVNPEVTPEIKLPEDIVSSGISVESASQSVTVSFTTNVAWSATVSAEWVTISPSSGEAGKNSVKVMVQENKTGQPRSAAVTITDKESTQKVSVTVRQEALAATLSVTPESLAFSANKGEEMLKVTSNTDWVITKDAEWITLDSDKGKGLATIAAGVTESTSLTSRTGVITVATSDGGVKKTVSVQQAGANAMLSVSPANMTFTAKAESQTFTVTSNTDWTATSDADWAKLSATGGNGNAQVTVTAEENTATKQRIAAITLKTKDGKTTATIKLSQNGADIIFKTDGDNREYEVGAEGGEIQFFVIHNIECYLKELPEWVILDNMQTYNGATWYKLKVIPNTSTSERGGIIVIRGLAEIECELRIVVIQAAGKPKGGNENTTTGGEITIE